MCGLELRKEHHMDDGELFHRGSYQGRVRCSLITLDRGESKGLELHNR